MKKLVLLFACLIFCFGKTNAQSYDAAVGIHIGYPHGISYKQFLNRSSLAFEGIAGVLLTGANVGLELDGLFLGHTPVVVDDLLVSYGGGAYTGTYGDEFFLGVCGALGLEYTFGGAPINFGFTVRPAFEFTKLLPDNTGSIIRPRGGFQLRYVF